MDGLWLVNKVLNVQVFLERIDKIHAHKLELQMVNYGEHSKFSFYKFVISKNKLTLKNTNGNQELKYSRIHQFPQ